MTKISIIIPLYNKATHIASTLRCVFDQTFDDYEIIVVDDGSTDNSAQIVKALQSEKIKLFSIKNQGVSHARNFGIKKAQGELISFLDADDLWKTNHLEQLFHLFKNHPSCGLYAMAYKKQINSLSVPSVYNTIPKMSNWSGIVDDFFESSFIDCIAWTSAVMIPKEIFEDVGGFNETITFGAGEDTDLWIRIALKYPIAFSNRVTAIYNLDSDNRLSNINTNLRNFLDLDAYSKDAKTNPSLHKYLDLNRFSIAIQYKQINNNPKAELYIDAIDLSNLNKKQRLLLKLSPKILRSLLKMKFAMQFLKINLSAFK